MLDYLLSSLIWINQDLSSLSLIRQTWDFFTRKGSRGTVLAAELQTEHAMKDSLNRLTTNTLKMVRSLSLETKKWEWFTPSNYFPKPLTKALNPLTCTSKAAQRLLVGKWFRSSVQEYKARKSLTQKQHRGERHQSVYNLQQLLNTVVLQSVSLSTRQSVWNHQQTLSKHRRPDL